MAFFASSSHPTKLTTFLNISFMLLLLFYIKTQLFHTYNSSTINISKSRVLHEILDDADGCTNIHDYTDYNAKCMYVKSHTGCKHKGYINYLEIFYCTFGKFPIIGYAVLMSWLSVLFYLLGNTAANYFCPSLESLSRILKLSPTIAGVTLLALGNGAPDVFASIISFTRTGDGGFGLNSVLGGAFFVSSVVVGVISILISPQRIRIDKPSFVRDVSFFFFALASLFLIVSIGRINLWCSICFLSIYFVYVGSVYVMHILSRKQMNDEVDRFCSSNISNACCSNRDDFEASGTPLLSYVDEKSDVMENGGVPQHDGLCISSSAYALLLDSSTYHYLSKLVHVLELPLQLPRRLTIPMVSEERWSKPYAVISVILAPVLLAALCNSQRDNVGFKSSTVAYVTAGLIGMVLGNIAYVTTKKSSPPSKCLFPWLAGGFLMSVTWTYIVAEELLSLLMSAGIVLGISPSVLGLTVLAWGNSLGDLIANVAMAVNGGADGVQIAISGCYAGPMFNTLLGLGLSLVFQSWTKYPASYEIPGDHSLYVTLGFLMGGLLWALVIVPKKNMKLDKHVGAGLLALYLLFLSLRVAKTIGLLDL